MTVERLEDTTAAPEARAEDQAVGAGVGADEAAPAAAEEPRAVTAGTEDAQRADRADDTATADPSPEAAIGSSGARALGGADEAAGRVDEAVDGMTAALGSSETASADRPGTDEQALPDRLATGQARDLAPSDEAGRAPGGAGGETGELPVTAPDSGVERSASELETPAEDGAPAAVAGGVAADDVAAAPAAADTTGPEATAESRPEPTTMEELLNEQTGEIRSLKHGDVVEGNVVRIDKDEILVDIGAKSEGVVSNRELYGRNAETQPQLNMGDTVLVYVLQPESEQGHAVLSLRRAGLERKWRAMQEQFEAGIIIEAPVIDHNKGGLIVDCGIRGFVPISQIVDFPRRPQNEQPRDAAQEIAEKLQPYVGRKLRLKILEVNRKANRLILSEKVALYEERREKRDELFSSLKVGQRVKGNVRSIAPFGVFVDLGGIDGLVHKSELSWNKVNNPEHGYKVGEEVEAEVIDINHERGRISLSIRRLQPDPWHSTVADLKVGDLIEGTVTKIVNFGAFVRVRDGLEGLIHISELSHQRVAHPGDVVHEGQRLRLKIISLDSERHRLGLSLKQAEEAPARPAAPEPRGERRPRAERAYDPSQAVQEPEGGIDNTLAAAFAQVRAQMEESEQSRAAPAADTAVPTMASAEAPEEVLGGAETGTAPAAETDDAPALEVGAATGAAPSQATETGSAEAVADVPEMVAEAAPEPTATAETAEPAAESTTPEPTAMAETPQATVTAETATPEPAATDETPAAMATVETPEPAAETTTPEATAETATPEATATDETAEATAAAAETESESEQAGGDAGPTAPPEETAESSAAVETRSEGSDDEAGSPEPVEGADEAAPAAGADRDSGSS